MIRVLYHLPQGQTQVGLPIEGIASALGDAEGLLWVDLVDEPLTVAEPLLLETFGFHPLAVEDALQESHVPKLDDWGSYLYITLHAVSYTPDAREFIETPELDLFVGPNYIVTYQTRAIPAVERVWQLVQRDERRLQRGIEHLLYQIADEIVSDYLPVVDTIDDELDKLEDDLFGERNQIELERIFHLKRALLHLRRIIAPQREVLNRLARGDYAVIDPQAGVFFRDVYDHLVRMYDITESLRDLLTGVLDTYLSVVNNRMNEIMKVLTIVSTLILPLTFISGFFGMNFFQPVLALDAWTGRTAFIGVITLMTLLPLGMYLWMRHRAWM